MMPDPKRVSYDLQIADAAWTPGKKDIVSLFESWESFSPAARERMVAKISRIDAPAAKVALNCLPSLNLRWRSELTRPVLKAGFKNFSQDRASEERKIIETISKQSLQHSEARIRKSAAQAIGGCWSDMCSELKEEMLAAMKVAANLASEPSELKAITDALGKSGDLSALSLLREQRFNGIGKEASRSIVKLTRDLAKTMDNDAGLVAPEGFQSDAPMVIWFTPGVELLVLRTPLFAGSQRMGPGVLKCDGLDWTRLQKSFLWRDAGFLIGSFKDVTVDSLISRIVAVSESIIKATKQTTGGYVRIRLGRGQHTTRSFLWTFAEKLMNTNCGIINDGRAPHWELVFVENNVVLVPRRYTDARFAWRSSQVEGSSDPTVAAAIVTMADIQSHERVYDPFCGAGTELILANKISGAVDLMGSDISREALDFAGKSLSKASVTAKLYQSDATNFDRSAFDVVISNPPFGMRTARGGARDVIESCLFNVSGRLAVGGRVVMLSHAPSSTRRWADAAGLTLTKHQVIKLGRMECELQCFVRR